jgi:hypothetical protein
MYAYKNLKTPKNIPSGLAEFVLIAPLAWISALSVPVAPFTNPGDEITIKTEHTFITGKGFVKHQLAPQKNKLDIKSRGEIGLNGQSQDLEVFIPGSYLQVHEQMKNWENNPLIVLAKDANSDADLWHQLGTDTVSAWMQVDFSTGTTKDGVKGYTAKIMFDGSPLFYNTGDEPVILADA